MKAIVHDVYGPPEVLHLAEVAQPTPRDGEVLIKVRATTVNRTDTAFRNPEHLVNRLVAGPIRPRRRILGGEFSGEVAAVGRDVTRFHVGDRVFGLHTLKFGAHAEYLCVSETGSLAPMPANFSFAEAAAVCDGLMFANNYVRRINITPATHILVNGASGSIGSAAVQLAKARGARVTAVCDSARLQLVKSLGADDVIDYTQEDFTRRDVAFDVVLDAVGKSSFGRCRRLLKPGGIYYSSELGGYWQNVLLAVATPLLGGKQVGFPIPTDSQADILFFQQLIEAGKYKAVIDRSWPLEEVVEATRYVEQGHKTGNVVITVQSS